jgi:hypothetical protein
VGFLVVCAAQKLDIILDKAARSTQSGNSVGTADEYGGVILAWRSNCSTAQVLLSYCLCEWLYPRWTHVLCAVSMYVFVSSAVYTMVLYGQRLELDRRQDHDNDIVDQISTGGGHRSGHRSN